MVIKEFKNKKLKDTFYLDSDEVHIIKPEPVSISYCARNTYDDENMNQSSSSCLILHEEAEYALDYDDKAKDIVVTLIPSDSSKIAGTNISMHIDAEAFADETYESAIRQMPINEMKNFGSVLHSLSEQYGIMATEDSEDTIYCDIPFDVEGVILAGNKPVSLFSGIKITKSDSTFHLMNAVGSVDIQNLEDGKICFALKDKQYSLHLGDGSNPVHMASNEFGLLDYSSSCFDFRPIEDSDKDMLQKLHLAPVFEEPERLEDYTKAVNDYLNQYRTKRSDDTASKLQALLNDNM